jgi:hypothetical protein
MRLQGSSNVETYNETKPDLFVAAMWVYERVGSRLGPGVGHAPTLGLAPMGSKTIHRPMAQKMVTQHRDRFWTSTYFDNSHRLRYDFEMKSVPLVAV